MAGLGLLLYGALRAAVGIGKAVDNAQMKSYSYKIDEQGRPTWIDREGHQYINGEKLVPTWTIRPDGTVKTQQVGQRSGRVYFDQDEARNQKMAKMDEKELALAQKYGDLAYNKWSPQHQRCLTTEISTGKIIAALYSDEHNNIYRKFYLKSKPVSTHGSLKSDPGDFGIPISKEEFKKLNILCGTFTNIPDWDVYHLIGTDKDPYKDVHPE